MASPAPKSHLPPSAPEAGLPAAETPWPAPDARPRLGSGYRVRSDEDDAAVLSSAAGDVPLNATAAQILLRCDGLHSVQRLVAELEAWFDAEGIADEVAIFLRASRDRGWLS